MSDRAWYLRRGVAWPPVLGCCALAVLVALVVGRWPATAAATLPVLLACCAGAAAFVFDEPATAVVAVTPRGALWRRTARAALVLLPVSVWAGVVLVEPGGVRLWRPGWLVLGAAVLLVAVGLAGAAGRRGVALPGASVACAVALALLAPLVVAPFLDLPSPYPLADFPASIEAFWAAVLAVGAVLVLAALAPGRRRYAPRAWTPPPTPAATPAVTSARTTASPPPAASPGG